MRRESKHFGLGFEIFGPSLVQGERKKGGTKQDDIRIHNDSIIGLDGLRSLLVAGAGSTVRYQCG